MDELSRRRFLRRAAAAIGGVTAARAALAQALPATTTATASGPASLPTTMPAEPVPAKIDRRAVVSRHDVKLARVDPATPLQVGNGAFAFGLDVTGLQTLADAYREKVPLNTMAAWAWHASPNPQGYTLDAVVQPYEVGGRAVPYAHDASPAGETSPASLYLRGNPHRASLARIGFVDAGDGAGAPFKPDSVGDVAQVLDLWRGVVTSRFTLKGQWFEVTTVAHPTLDCVAFRIARTGAVADGDLSVRIAFPAAQADWKDPDDWQHPESHVTVFSGSDTTARFDRRQDEFAYVARARWAGLAAAVRVGDHAFDLPLRAASADLVVGFSPMAPATDAPVPSFDETLAAAAKHWESFWSSGAAIDFSACTDGRAVELERRVVLSQYLTAVHCANAGVPPGEAGLAFNAWYGKPQLGSHVWHAPHFALWGRWPMAARSLDYYRSIFPQAKSVAERQGYGGARWPWMAGPDGRESPGEVGPFLVWHQPHPIYLAELAYRDAPTRETLERHAEVVEQTARFMASYARLDPATKRYVLGPAIVPAQESYRDGRATTLNPTFELAYWVWGLGVAQKWRERLGQPREDRWGEVIDRMSRPTVRDGRYAAVETEPFLVNADHPSFLLALGLLPKTHLIDEAVMRESARWTKAKWKWNEAWGWDFAALAMTAARLGDAELAVDALTIESEKNRYTANGHNFQTDGLPVYLPGNGALLAAVAMMAGGWDGVGAEATADRTATPAAPAGAPGFPKGGKWNVRVEGFARSI